MFINFESERIPVELAYDLYNPRTISSSNKNNDSIPIVIIPCLFGRKSDWEDIASELTLIANRKVFVLDCRNHGESPHHPNGDYYDMAADVQHFMANQNISKCHLMGHSMGGRIAIMVSLLKPNLVKSLICLDISPFSEPESMEATARSYIVSMKRAIRELPRDITLEDAKKICETKFEGLRDSPMKKCLSSSLICDDLTGYDWLVNLDFLYYRFKPDFQTFPLFETTKGFKGPTKFVFSQKSEHIQNADHLKIYKSFPQGEIFNVEGEKGLFENKCELLLETIREFFETKILL